MGLPGHRILLCHDFFSSSSESVTDDATIRRGRGGSRGGQGAPAFPPPPQVRHVTPRALLPGLAGLGNNGQSTVLNVTVFGRVRDQGCRPSDSDTVRGLI